MGIIQGLSEFLPISSSAHLVFTSNFYKLFRGIEIVQNSNEEVFFDIMVHFGTLIAVIIFFRKDIINIIRAFCHALNTKDWSSTEAKLGLFILIGTVLTVLVAYPLNVIAEKLVFLPSVVGILLFITGFVLLYCEYKSKKTENKKSDISFKDSIFIGIAQGLASLPGFSRSGWTIATGLFFGIDRVTAARYSFLLSIPIILCASMGYPLLEIDIKEALNYNWTAILIGTAVSGVTGYLCIKYFMKFISKFSLSVFGYYCLIMGLITTIFFNIYG